MATLEAEKHRMRKELGRSDATLLRALSASLLILGSPQASELRNFVLQSGSIIELGDPS